MIPRINHVGHLGIVYQIRGDLEHAETLHRQALDHYLALEQIEGMPSQYSNLGHIYRIRGDLEEAENLYQKALEYCENLEFEEGYCGPIQ